MNRDDKLIELNDKLAEALLSLIMSGEAKAADLNVARQYLKDNNLSAILSSYEDPDADSPILQLAGEIQKELDDFDQQSATG
jgi:predicted S18 family serine protease